MFLEVFVIGDFLFNFERFLRTFEVRYLKILEIFRTFADFFSYMHRCTIFSSISIHCLGKYFLTFELILRRVGICTYIKFLIGIVQ